MHASVEKLLSLRDGELVDASVSQHVSECVQCSSELESYRRIKASLNELPELAPSGDLFAGILEHASPARRGHERLKLAVAASVIALLSITLLQYISKEDTLSKTPIAENPILAPAPTTPTLGELMADSARLEEALQRVSYGGRDVMDVRTADTIVALEDRLALVDYHLSYNRRLTRRQTQALWQARVQLMDSLVNVRYAQLQNTSY